MKKKDGSKNSSVLVIGAGVSGLTTALCLARNGYRVKVIYKEMSPNITSNVAGALWEWPPAVCGYHVDLKSLERSKTWCMKSYDIFYDLAKHEETGVFIKDVTFFFREKVENNELLNHKMCELMGKVKGFEHDESLIQREGVNTQIGLVDAYKHEAPMVNTDVYMNWLMEQNLAQGVEFKEHEICDHLTIVQEQLLSQYNCQWLVNCSGLGSIKLANEYMFPLRGALVRLKNKANGQPLIDKAYCISFDEHTREQDIVFVVPRGENLIVLGALAEDNEWDLSINLENHEPVREMFRRCKEFLPILEDAEIDQDEPVRVGLRPFRKENVRLDWEKDHKIIHNYGHGGAGITFSWGCAEEVVDMIDHACSVAKQSLALTRKA